MKIKYFFRLVVTFILLFTCYHLQAQQDTIINRYRSYLFRSQTSENIKPWISTLNEKHQWKDINYEDTEPANWKNSKHLLRVRALALEWANPHSSYYQNEVLWNTISPALDYWLEKRFQSSNWWHNQIGVPQFMRDIIILTLGKLTPEQLKQSLEVLAQHRVSGTGGNLVWSADLGIHYAALTNNKELLKKYSQAIIDEIKISTGEGIKPDFSFHQHGARLQMYQYGKAYFWESARLAWQVRGTPWAFPKEKVNILADMAINGWQWMARGIYTVPGTIDRSVSREGELSCADIRPLIPFLCELCPEKSAVFNNIADIQNGKGSLHGFKNYPFSDFTVYHRKDFSFFLKTISTRTLATESINNENLKGRLLDIGDAYLMRDGSEYFNLMPVWDWELLPGITNFKGKSKISRQDFVGSVGNSECGLSAMNYRVEDKENHQSLAAHKVWVCKDDIVVCLISDIRTENIQDEVYTALDQCRWQGGVTVNEPGNVLKEGNQKLKNVKWIHHNGFAYIPIEPANIDLNLNTNTGTWHDINYSQSDVPITEKVFKPVMVHPLINSESIATGYVLAASKTAQQAKKLQASPSWKIASNDKNCQAVSFKDGTTAIAFFSAGSLTINKAHLVVDKPCLILLSKNRFSVSDPNHSGGAMKISWKDKDMTVEVPKDGSTTEVDIPERVL